MMKITQFLTNIKLWQGIFFSFLLLVSLNLNSQNVGDDLLANSNGQVDTSSGWTGSGAGCFSWGGGTYDGVTQCGWTSGAGLNYAPSNNNHGPTHSGDRMFKSYKTNGTNGEFIAQEVGELALGTYTYSFFHRWTGGSIDYTEGAPKFTIKEQNADGGWDNVLSVDLAEGNTGANGEWTETTGTWVNENVNNYKIQVYKNGVANAGLAQNLHLDTFSFVYSEAAASGVSTFPFCSSFDTDLGDWTTDIVQGTSDWTSAASNTTTGSNSVDAYSGGGSAYYYDYSYSGNGSTLISPVMDLSGIADPQVTFQLANPDWSGDQDTLAVWYRASDADAWAVLGTYTDDTITYDEITLSLPNASSTYQVAFNATSGYGYGIMLDDVCVDAAPTNPSMAVTATTDDNSATFSFDIANFTVGASGDTGVDGHIHYSLNGGSEVMVYSSDDLTLTDLPYGTHTIVFSLVDESHAALDPAVEASVTFTLTECSYTLSMVDSYGDGWNGNSIELFANGVSLGSFANTSAAGAGEAQVVSFGVNTGDVITSTWTTGSYLSETSYSITDTNGNVVFEASASSDSITEFTASCVATANVTFTVNTANIEVGANGMYLGGGVFGGANAHAMSDADSDGTWEVTVAMEVGTTGNYIFLNSPNSDSDWGTKENLEGQDCADPANYNDRILPAIDGDMTIQHCFGSCESDGTCPAANPTYNVTFNVNMSNYPGGLGADDTVHLNGSFAGWCGDCTPMSDDDGDGIYTVTIPLEDGDYEYKFTVNGWSNQESWTADGTPDCAENADDGSYENRAFSVAGSDMTLDTVYWNLCVGEEPGNTYTVTFSVNTSAIVGGVGANGIYAGGGVLGNAQALQLSDDDGDGVWVGSIDLPEGTTGNYIFLNSPSDGGDWGAKENLEGQDCADTANYNDRILPEVTADVTYLHCFGECSGNGTGECPSDTVTWMLTMTVNTANITVGENGMYLGGGYFGGANAYEMLDDDNDGTWEVTVEVEDGAAGNYAFFNSPGASDDWGTKENIEGQACADPANYNDRILDAVTADTTLMHCFGSCETDGSCPEGDPSMMLQGIIDFTVPEGGSAGKAIHLYVNDDIADLAQYGIGVANNGGGTDGQEYTFPTAAPTAGQHILVVRDQAAMDAYMNASAIFDHVFVDEGGSISQNGDDAIELYFLGGVVEVFGDVDVDGTGEAWEYLDSWAYKVNGEWTYGGVNCTDGSTTSCDSGCPYPFADCTGDDLGAYLSAEGGWRLQYEVAGYRGVGPADSMGADWWNSQAYEDFNSAAWPNPNGVNHGLVDDIMLFTTDGGFTFDTGEDGAIMGKKPEVDAAFDPDGTNAYEADNEYNEYWTYPLGDFTDTYTLSNDGTYDVIEFATVGALGFYTSTGAQAYHILQQNNTTMYVRNVGSEGNAWYSMLTTDAHALSTSDNEILDMMVYPNPVDGNYVTILSPVQGSKEIQVFTVTGRKVMDTVINGNTLDVSSFNSGFYMLKVTINGQSKVSKLVVR